MRVIGVFACFLAANLICSVSAEPKISTYSFPGYMKIVVEQQTEQRPVVDYLFVVDDSGSMQAHQNNLAAKIDVLVRMLNQSNADYHAAVISTDAVDGSRSVPGSFRGYPTVITEDTPNSLGALRKNLTLGTYGSGLEEVFKPLLAALSEPLLSSSNKGFLRDGAHLSVIVLTDAEDQGSLVPQDVAQFLTELKGDPHLVTVDGFLAHSGTDPAVCPRDQVDVPPLKIEHLITLTGGDTFNICEADMTSALEIIGGRILPTRVEWVKRIPMMVTPKVDTIEVTYGDQTLPPGDIKRGWTYDYLANEILLGDEIEWTRQPNGTSLEVKFVPMEWTL